MGDPVVVQGTAVQEHQQQQHPHSDNNDSLDPNFSKGEKQESKCRDPIFAFLFYGNVIAIAVTCAFFGTDAFQTIDDTTSGVDSSDYSGYIWVMCICAAFATIFSGLSLIVMMRIPTLLIKTALIFSVLMSLVGAVWGFASGNIWMGVMGTVFFLIGCCYARAVWSRIPFATANLKTACASIRSNCGVVLISFLFVLIAFAWSFLWAIAFVGTFNSTYSCTEVGGSTVCSGVNYGLLFLLFVSYFFAHQVFTNTVHVIVAGTVGVWWFDPEEGSSCCSSAVIGSSIRAVTTSFGSICFGSLIVAVIQALRALANEARSNGDAGALACVAECILGCLQGIAEYFNKWAFIYVGLYGYSYLEAGKNVITLFRNRGWDAIIADDLIGNVLFLVSVIVGGISGVIGIIIQSSAKLLDDVGGNEIGIAFGLGFVVGLVLCSIFLGAISSAVNAIVVLFAEAPAEFQQNYPELSNEMMTAWSGAFPGSV
mmetsp:Transcript_3315/g.5417  ORF Transcript_3315/g.5417 Transcript_3315/m.5417 type:complete len:483 (-) Transcript_3315:91-1539(-)|eukprot:CAMPEP_0119013076 /NCGR_PEP_ID=MMETSP1176-20130426/7873_1 /TAXON_ID=265551 /ORGANISM="Synedropsis recta cf, Strain CCMP1620" /LENGTH=482 /DNA_ID=CAMNT_0006966127 /DNA_START=108 /DNA_END=1556 /DNA_ORIENTATION=+